MSYLDTLRQSFRNNSIKSIFVSILVIILLLQGVNSFVILNRSIKDFRLSQNIFLMNEVSDDLFKAVANLGFERGRVNVVLNDTGDPEGMEGNRTFILARRLEGEAALERAIEKLSPGSLSDQVSHIEEIYAVKEKISTLRSRAEENLSIPWEERDHELADLWFTRMTQYIEAIESLLAGISQSISDADGVIGRYSSLKLSTMALRNTAGPEMSILSATILSGKPLREDLKQKILSLQVSSNEKFKDLKYQSSPWENTPLYRSLTDLEKVYTGSYRNTRNRIISEAETGGPYSLTQEEYLSQGVDILNQIAAFMDIVVQQTSAYTAEKYQKSRKDIHVYTFFSLASLLFLLVVFILVNNRILKQTNILTNIIIRLGKKETDVTVPNLKSLNEIGDMSRAVDVFKNTLITLDEKILDLERISQEKENLIVELRKALEEVNALREIIPICSYCKKIRNDQGYYESVEQYFSRHKDTDFSHTICPDCMEEHFPDFTRKRKGKRSPFPALNNTPLN